MKKRFLVIAALIGLLAACRDPAGGHPDDIINNPNPNPNPKQETVIVFDNTQGTCTALVYEDYRRRDEDKIAEIPAGESSPEIEWTPGTSIPFYFSYRVNLKGINGFTLNYTPREVGKDQTAVRIDANTKTTITIPKLNETVSSPDALLSNNSYILIQNNASFSFELLRGDSSVRPDNITNSAVVISGERAQYTINAGAVSNYRLLLGADYVPFPGSMVSFEAGCVYSFVFNNGALSLISEVELKLENVAGVSSDKPVPEAPGAPAVTAFDSILTVRWLAVEGAESYEVYISAEQEPPALPERTVYTNVVTLTGLTNKTVYYLWIKAANENGASDFSPRAQGIPWPADEIPAVPEMPVIIPAVNQLTVNWEETNGASSYEVYINTVPSTPSSAALVTDKANAVITNLENNVVYYIWVCAVNSAGKSGYSSIVSGTPRIPTVAPASPARPVLATGNKELAVSWQAVEIATSYEVWFGTLGNSAQAQKFGIDISGTETVITGLTNEQTYYVWIKAKNIAGTSGFSLPANAKPSAFVVLPETPALPTVTPGSRELAVSWQAVEGALSYELWMSVTNNPVNADKHGADISGASVTLANLINETTYYIWIKAKNYIGESGFSPMASGTPSASAATPPALFSAPAVTAGSGQLSLSWQAVEGASAYEIWAGTTINPTTASKRGSDLASTSASIAGLSNGTTYYVWIKAKNSVGTSGFSPMASGTPSAFIVVPAAPATLAVSIGNEQITVSWTAVEGATAYEIWLGTTNNSTAAAKNGDDVTTSLSRAITSLSNGTTYYVWIKAKNNVGTSGFSPAASGKPIANTSVVVITSGNGLLSINWAAIAGADQYEVFYGTGINPPQTASQTVTVTTATITGLTNDTSYNVWVRGRNSTGTGTMSLTASAKPIGDMGAVSLVSGDGQLSLSWSAVAGADQYEVYQNTGNSIPANAAQIVNAPATTATITGLANGTNYYVWVKPKNANGAGSASAAVSGIPLGTPGALTLSAANQQIMVSWNSVSGAANYEVYYSTTSTIPVSPADTVTGLNRTFTGLTNGTTYYFWIKAVNASGTSAASQAASGKPIGSMGAVTLMSGNERIIANWPAVAGADQYEVYYSTSNSIPANPTQTVNAPTTTVTINGLANGTTYYVWVKPKNNNGTGGPSTVVSGVPMAISNELTISAANQQITVSWDAVPGATSYEVYRSTTTTIPASPSATVTTFSHTSASLSNGTTYYFWVKAVNANGTGEASPMASGKPVGNMGTVTLVSGNGQLSASWSTVAGADQYEVYHSASNSIPANPAQTVTTATAAITGLTNGTTYYVWVKPRNTNGAGNTSAASGKPIANMGAVTLATGGSGELVLSWSAVAGADQYEVYHSTTNTMPASPAQTVYTTAATITGLTNGTTYYVWVRPKNANGTGNTSAAVSGVPMSPPGNLTVSAANQQITVSWDSVTNAASYEVFYSQSATIPANPLFTVTETSRTITGLTNGTTYYFWVKAVSASGTSAASPMASGKPVGNMGTVTLTPGNNQVSLSWSVVAGADQYEIYHNTSNSIPATLTQTVSTTTATVTGLTNGTTYYVWVKPRNANGTGGTSTAVSGMPMAAPGALTVSAENQQITVSWATVPGAVSYEVYRSTSTTIPASPSDTVTTLSHTSTGLTNGTMYNFWVKAVNASWTSAASPMASGKPVGNMGTVTVSTGDTSGQLVLSWTSVSGADQYEVYRSTTSTMPVTPSQTVTATTVTITGLTNGATYYVWVKPKNASGTGGISAVANGTPIAAPGNISLSTANQQITVSWTAVSGANSYEVYYSTNTIMPASPAYTGVGLNGTFTGLTYGTTYYFWVKAVSTNGTGNASQMANVKLTRVGLYKGGINEINKVGTQNLTASLSYISSNAVSGDNYFIIIGADESVPNFTLNYSGKIIGITLIGEGGEQRIMLNTNGRMFTILTDVTLTLDENISLIGRNANNESLIYLTGKLVINEGAKISGNTTSNTGGGISVSSGGTVTINGGTISGNTASNDGGGIYISGIPATVTMNGGTISGNTASNGGGINVGGGTFTMNGGTISGNTASSSGGGIYVGTFVSGLTGSVTMYGGIISGNTANSNRGGGVYRGSNGTFKKLSGGGQNSGIIYGSDAVGNDSNGVPLRNTVSSGSGHAVYSSSSRSRNTTAGEIDEIDTSTGRGLSYSGNPPYDQ